MGLRSLKISWLKRYKNASLLLFCGVMVCWCSCVESSSGIKIPEDKKFSGLLMFGDSLGDPGNNNNMITLSKANYPPYGKDFKGGMPSGRFSNGKITGDFIASELSIKEYLPAYRDPNLQPADLITGVSFASGGSGYDPLSSLLATATTLAQQLDLFKEYKSKLYSLVGIRKAQYDISSYTSLMASFAADFLENLYAEGARRIGLFNAPPLGRLPIQRTLSGGAERECVEEINQASQMFNSKLTSVVDSFNSKYSSDAKAVIVDVFNPLLSLIKNPKQNGFEVPNKGCCGTGLYEVVLLCSPINPTTCPDASKYVFWDSIHPTETAYKKLIAANIALVLA